MILAASIFNKSFVSSENETPILIIENKEYYRQTIKSIFDEIDGAESEFSFYVNDKQINVRKELEIILDYFALDINKSKNITKLHTYIKTEYVNEENYAQSKNLINNIVQFMADIITDVDYKLTYDENIDLQNIFKAINLRFDYQETELLEKFVDYIKITSSFFGKKLFVLVNFKSLFTLQEQKEIYKFFNYNKIEAIIIESEQPKEKLQGEIYRIIDNDLCVIY